VETNDAGHARPGETGDRGLRIRSPVTEQTPGSPETIVPFRSGDPRLLVADNPAIEDADQITVEAW
jgi:hypothetical protein